MDEEQGLVSPIAGGIRGIRRSVSSSIFTGRAVPPAPDPQTTSLLSQNSLTLTNVSGQLANISTQVGSLNNSLAIIKENLAISDQLERQREAAERRREAILAEQGLREGKESGIEKRIQFALLAPVRKVQTATQGILSRLTNFLLILAGGWLVEQTLQFIRLKSEGNVDALNKLKVRIVTDLLVVGTTITVISMAVIKAALLLKSLAGLAFRFVVGTFIKKPFKLLANFIKNNVKNFATLLKKQFGKLLTSAPKAAFKLLKNPLSILGAIGIGGVGVKESIKNMNKPPVVPSGSKGIASKIFSGKGNAAIAAIFGAFDFIARRQDKDNDGTPDQSIFQAATGVISRIVGSGVGFAGGMKIGALIGTFVGGPPGTLVGGIIGGISGLIGSMIVGGMAESAADKLTGVTKDEGDGSNVEPADTADATVSASAVNVGTSLNVTPINKKKEIASKLELEEGSPTIINIPLKNQNMSGTGSGGASSEKGDSQPLPNIPSSDFANTSIVMAESMFNLGGVNT